jgi:hypothetical protein
VCCHSARFWCGLPPVSPGLDNHAHFYAQRQRASQRDPGNMLNAFSLKK